MTTLVSHTNDESPALLFNGFVGRIPIYDRSLNLFGYDLKVCGIEHSSPVSGFGSMSDATDSTIIRASEEVALSDLVGGNCGFLSVSDSLLSHVDDLSWPKEQVVLKIPAAFYSESRMACIRELHKAGYRIAIERNSSAIDELDAVKAASVCSIDAAGRLPETSSFVARLHDHGIKLFARNIESSAQFELLQSLGCDLFQGKYFEQPKPVTNHFIAANKAAALELLARLNDPKVVIEEVERLVSQDVTLSYKILRLINTAYFGMPKRIESIGRAVLFFGLDRIKNWASVIVYNSIEYKPRELLTTALVRARTCEMLAEKLGRKKPESYFVAGLFSMLDAIIDLPISEIVEQIKLSEEICAALVEGTGPISEILTSFLAIENGVSYPSVFGLLNDGIALECYIEAIRWVNSIQQAIAD